MARRKVKSDSYAYAGPRRGSAYEAVATAVSTSGKVDAKTGRPREWTIKRRVDTGALSCDCPAWIFRGELDADGRRTCKHIKSWRAGDLQQGGLRTALVDEVAEAIRAAASAAQLAIFDAQALTLAQGVVARLGARLAEPMTEIGGDDFVLRPTRAIDVRRLGS